MAKVCKFKTRLSYTRKVKYKIYVWYKLITTIYICIHTMQYFYHYLIMSKGYYYTIYRNFHISSIKGWTEGLLEFIFLTWMAIRISPKDLHQKDCRTSVETLCGELVKSCRYLYVYRYRYMYICIYIYIDIDISVSKQNFILILRTKGKKDKRSKEINKP